MTTATALAQLRDALRTELIAEMVEKLEAWRDGLGDAAYDRNYLDGIDDAIITIQEG